MESRGLLRKNSIAKADTSSGFKMWIAEKENAPQLEKFNAVICLKMPAERDHDRRLIGNTCSQYAISSHRKYGYYSIPTQSPLLFPATTGLDRPC